MQDTSYSFYALSLIYAYSFSAFLSTSFSSSSPSLPTKWVSSELHSLARNKIPPLKDRAG